MCSLSFYNALVSVELLSCEKKKAILSRKVQSNILLHFQRNEVWLIALVKDYLSHVSFTKSSPSTIQSVFDCDVKHMQCENWWYQGRKWSRTEDAEVEKYPDIVKHELMMHFTNPLSWMNQPQHTGSNWKHANFNVWQEETRIQPTGFIVLLISSQMTAVTKHQF